MEQHRARRSSIAPHERDAVATVSRINRRWIAHGGLKDSAAGYIRSLETSDPQRLHRSCELALALIHSHGRGVDPKPWFYAGLFAFANAHEAARFLDGHSLTWSVWSALHNQPADPSAPESLRELAMRISDQIRRFI
jgi:hypothetical protein